MATIRFTVPGECVGKQRPRVYRTATGGTHAMTPEKTVSYETLVKWALTNTEGFKMLTGEIEAHITVYMQMAKSMSKKDKKLVEEGKKNPTKRPDIDNLAKSILDACNGIAYKDDAYVTRAVIEKRYALEGEEARTEVMFRERFEKK